MRRLLFVLALATLSIAATRQRAVRLPPEPRFVHFRGDAARSGSVAEAGPRSIRGVRWQRSLDAPTFSAPVLADGVLYATAGGFVSAIDAESGAVRWRSSRLPDIVTPAAVTDALVIVGTDRGLVVALDRATGATAWSVDRGATIFSPPLVAAGAVFTGAEDGSFASIDLGTRAVRWRITSADPFHAAPAYAKGIVYASAGSALFALTAATGAELWRGPGAFSIAVSNGAVYAVTGSGDELAALDAYSGRELWRIRRDGVRGWSAPALAQGVVYVSADDGAAYAFDATSGALLWRHAIGSMLTNPLYAEGVLYLGSSAGVTALESATGNVLWSAPVTGGVGADVAIGSRRVYAQTAGGSLSAFEE